MSTVALYMFQRENEALIWSSSVAKIALVRPQFTEPFPYYASLHSSENTYQI